MQCKEMLAQNTTFMHRLTVVYINLNHFLSRIWRNESVQLAAFPHQYTLHFSFGPAADNLINTSNIFANFNYLFLLYFEEIGMAVGYSSDEVQINSAILVVYFEVQPNTTDVYSQIHLKDDLQIWSEYQNKMVEMLILDPKDQISIVFLSSVDPFPQNQTFITTLIQQIYFDHFMAMNQVQIMIYLNYIPEGHNVDGRQMAESCYYLQFVTEEGQLSKGRVFVVRETQEVFLLFGLKPYLFIFMHICLRPPPIYFYHIRFLTVIYLEFDNFFVDGVNIGQFGVEAGLLLSEIDSSKHSKIILPAFIIFLDSSLLFLDAEFLPYFISDRIELFDKLSHNVVQLTDDLKHLVTEPTDIVQLLLGVERQLVEQLLAQYCAFFILFANGFFNAYSCLFIEDVNHFQKFLSLALYFQLLLGFAHFSQRNSKTA